MDSAAAAAVGRYNRGRFHLAEVMYQLSMDVNQSTLQLLLGQDMDRILKMQRLHSNQASFSAGADSVSRNRATRLA